MKAAFDSAAADYDVQFTQTLVGQAQRQRVWEYLTKKLNSKTPLRILELNCGTGEDAAFLASLGHQVVATDISEEMLAQARTKAKGTNITFQQLDITDIKAFGGETAFDVIFSNFGGFNCLSPTQIQIFAQELPRLLKYGGKFIAVVMPDMCLLEQLYLVCKLRFGQVRRRYHQPLEVKVDGTIVPTWYYAPSHFNDCLSGQLIYQEMQLIGLIPSYLNTFFSRKVQLFKRITRIENSLIKQAKGEYVSDHYLIAFQKN